MFSNNDDIIFELVRHQSESPIRSYSTDFQTIYQGLSVKLTINAYIDLTIF